MRKDSSLAEKDVIFAEDLWDKPLIISHQASNNAAQFVKKRLGYVIALDKLINTTGDSNLCFKPLSPTLEAELFIVWKKYQVLSKTSSVFLRQLKEDS